jgi:hypothetical protein
VTTGTINHLSALEDDMEQTRERLAGTIDELVSRASPRSIVGRQLDTAKAHFADPETGAPRTDNILKVAGAVVGVAVAFVILRRFVR